MWRILSVVLMLGCLVTCAKPSSQAVVEPGNGRLVRWSAQITDSPKKIVFIPGNVITTDPHGLNPTELEDYFSIKIGNFEQLGPEMFGAKTSALVEYWLCGYYPNQDIAKVAGDVATAIANNGQLNDNCVIAIVAHSEGAVVGWVLDQRYRCVAGGALLGGPILSTPVAHKAVRDKAVEKTFPLLHARLIPLFDQLAVGTEQITVSYPESGVPNSHLKFWVGRIDVPSVGFWGRNINLVDALLAERGFMDGIQDNHQFAELGATIIAQSEWGDGGDLDLLSDGLVTVPSGTLNGQAPYYQVLDDYDHWDLMGGKGDLSLDRSILEWLDQVLRLTPNWAETDLPATPDIIELSADVSLSIGWARFAYVDADNRLTLADDNWDKTYTLPMAGFHGHPQFDDAGESLVFDVDDNGVSNVYVLSEAAAKQISFDGRSRCPAWSPNEQWLTYQSSGNLLIHHLTTDERYVVANEIELLAPPVWTVNRLSGRLYFVNNNQELRWVSPRERRSSSTNLVQSNCGRPLIAQSSYRISGMAVISSPSETTGETVNQRVTVVTGALAGHFSVDISYDPNKWDVDYTNGQVSLLLDRPFSFTEAVYDGTYNHLYLVGEWDGAQGIYLLDIQAFLDCTKENPLLSDFFSLIREGASQLAIRPPR